LDKIKTPEIIVGGIYAARFGSRVIYCTCKASVVSDTGITTGVLESTTFGEITVNDGDENFAKFALTWKPTMKDSDFLPGGLYDGPIPASYDAGIKAEAAKKAKAAASAAEKVAVQAKAKAVKAAKAALSAV